MIDILTIVLIGMHVAGIAKRKNRNPVGYVLLVVFGFYGGGILGAVVCGFGAESAGVHDDYIVMIAIAGLILGVLSGIGFAYLVVMSASPLDREDDGDDYEPRRRRRYRAEDDEEYRPPRRRRREYED